MTAIWSSSAPASSDLASRLDPVALPQETRGRFGMFFLAAIIFTWSLGSWWIEVPNAFTQVESQAAIESSPPDPPVLPEENAPDASSTDDPTTIALARDRAYVRLYLWRLVGCSMLLILLAATTWLFYTKHPRRVRKSAGAEPITDQAVLDEVSRLVRLAEVDQSIKVEQRQGFLSGLAYGLKNRECLVLTDCDGLLGGPLVGLARAVALHEIAHIVNGDIRTRELSRSVWLALSILLGLTLVALSGTTLLRGGIRFPMISSPLFLSYTNLGPGALARRSLLIAAILLGVAWWIWAGLVRMREFYADARVVSWGYRQELLQRLELPDAFASRLPLLRMHPSNQERAEKIRQPWKLFQVSRGFALLNGLLLTLVAGQLVPLLNDLTLATGVGVVYSSNILGSWSLVIMIAAALLISFPITYLASSALAAQIQREAIADLVLRPHHSWGYFTIWKVAFFFAIGCEIGLALSPMAIALSLRSIQWSFLWLIGLCVFMWLWMLQIRAAARLLLGSETCGIKARRKYGSILLISSVTLTFLSLSLYAFRISASVASNEVLASLPGGAKIHEPSSFIVFFLLVPIILIGFAVGFYIAVGIGLVGLVVIRLARGHSACRHCGSPIGYRLVIGRWCRNCRKPLADWILSGPQGEAP